MGNKLKTYQIIFSIVNLSICSLIAIIYGWQGYATLTERPGLRGYIHIYYQLTMAQFATYNLSTAFFALVLIFYQLKFLKKKDAKNLNITFWIFGLLIILIISARFFLHSRFVIKG